MFEEDNPNSDMPATEMISSVLMEPFFGKGHVPYTDIFTPAGHLQATS